MVKRCVEYYNICQKHQNNEYYNDEKQQKRLIEWYKKVKKNAENSNDIQLKMYANKRSLNANRCKNETIKRQIYNFKEFEKRMEKTKKNDIRRYFEM